VYTDFWWGDLREGDHLTDTGIDGRVILKWIFNMWDRGHGLDLSGSVTVADSCECGNEPSGSIKCEELLNYLRKW
jgi:hypothetical protein